MDIHFELRRGELELSGEVLTDPLFGATTAGAGLLVRGQVVLDAVVGEMIESESAMGAQYLGPGQGWGGIGLSRGDCFALDRRVVEVEQMTLVRVVDVAFATRSEDIAAKQREGLGQLGVFLLQMAVVGRGLVKHALKLVDAALSVFGLPLSVFGSPL